MAATSAWNAGDVERFRAVMAPDLEVLARRSVVNTGDQVGDDAVDALLSLLPMAPLLHAEVIERRGADLGMTRLRFTGDLGVVEFLSVRRVDRLGRLHRMATFDIDDRDRALAELDAWDAETRPPMVDPDSRVARRTAVAWRTAWNDRDHDRLRSLLAGDLVHSTNRVLGFDGRAGTDAIEFALSARDAFPRVETTVLATPNQEVVLEQVRMQDGTGLEFSLFGLIVVDADDQIAELRTFDGDDAEGALRALATAAGRVPDDPRSTAITYADDALATRFVGSPQEQFWRHVLGAWSAGPDDPEFRRIWGHPDLEVDSRRTAVNSGDATGDEAHAVFASFAAVFPHFDIFHVLDARDRTVLTRQGLTDDAGNELRFLAVVEFGADGIMRRFANVDDGDVDGARSVFEAWTSTVTPATGEVTGPTLPGLTAQAMCDAWTARDPTAFRALLDPDVEFATDRTVASAGDPAGADETIDAAIAVFEMTDDARFEPIESRGGDLQLQRATYLADGAALDVLQVVQVDGLGRISRMATFDVDDRRTAREVLDAWHAEPRWYGEPVGAHADTTFVRLLSGHSVALQSRDAERIEAVSAPDFTVLAERDVGALPRAVAIEGMLGIEEAFPNLEMRFLAQPVPNVGMGYARRWNDDGFEMDMLALIRFAPDGRCRAIAAFEPRRPGDALALLADWAADTADEPPAVRHPGFGNLATFEWVHGTMARAVAAELAGVEGPARFGFTAEAMSPDVVRVDHRGISLEPHGREEWLAALQMLWDLGFRRLEGIEAIEEHGEHRVLAGAQACSDTDDVLDLLAVLEVDDGGLLVRLDLFDPEDRDRARTVLRRPPDGATT